MTFAYIADNGAETYKLTGTFHTYAELRDTVLKESHDYGDDFEFISVLSSTGDPEGYTNLIRKELEEMQVAISWNRENQTDALGFEEKLAYYESRFERSDREEHGTWAV